jgi:hypothetical protein
MLSLFVKPVGMEDMPPIFWNGFSTKMALDPTMYVPLLIALVSVRTSFNSN